MGLPVLVVGILYSRQLNASQENMTSSRIWVCKSQPAATKAGVMNLVQTSRSESFAMAGCFYFSAKQS